MISFFHPLLGKSDSRTVNITDNDDGLLYLLLLLLIVVAVAYDVRMSYCLRARKHCAMTSRRRVALRILCHLEFFLSLRHSNFESYYRIFRLKKRNNGNK